MKHISLVILGVLLTMHPLFAQTAGSSGENRSKKMNVVFYLVDDLGWADVGYEGSQFYETPNIDHFSQTGVRFNQAYAACHVCSPSRASILTGQYPARLHLTDWLPGRKDFPFQKLENAKTKQHLPYHQKTLPQVLKDNGYQTAIFGKWHLGQDSNSTQRQGFDIHVPDYNTGWPNNTYFSPYGMKGLEGGPTGEYLTDRLTSEALKWMEKHKDRPFFLYLAQFGVHDPIQGRPDLVQKYENKLKHLSTDNNPAFILENNPDDNPDAEQGTEDTMHQGYRIFSDRTVKIKQRQDNPQFAAMVDCIDENFGRVLAKLEALGLAQNTIVIFYSDNGGMSAANFGKPTRKILATNLNKAYSTSNLPLRGGKGWLYEGGIREPLLVYWPHHGLHGITTDVPMTSTDFYATILDMLGIDPRPRGDDGIDGRSIVPIFEANKTGIETLKQRPLFWHFPQYSNHGAQSPGGAVRLGDYKLIEYYENGSVQLFNIKKDPGELHEISKEDPKTTTRLVNLLHKWRQDVGAAMPAPNPHYQQQSRWPGEAVKVQIKDPKRKKNV